MNIRYSLLITLLFFSLKSLSLSVQDSLGNEVVLEKPAAKIVALSPHIVENLFSAGAGENIVASVDHCDYPEAALTIPRLGTMGSFGLEPIVDLKPDLVVIWYSGKGVEIYNKLKELGLTVYASAPKTLSDIAESIKDFGVLTDNEDIANKAASQFEHDVTQLSRTYSQKQKVRSFYQVWYQPMLSINKDSLIHQVIELCGGTNVFADSPALVPKLSIESVISKDPEVIVASGLGDLRPAWLDDWKDWPSISAVANNKLFHIHPDLIQRHSLRVLEGAKTLCQQLEQARTYTKADNKPPL